MLSLLTMLLGGPAVLAWPETRDVPDLTAQWEVNHTDLLSGFRNLYNPMVVYDGRGEYPYRMWLFGWAAEDDNPGYAGADAVFAARSRDLVHWEVYAGEAGWDTTMTPSRWVPVLTAGQAPWDNVHNGDPSVVKRDGRYYMAFSSVGFDTRADADGQTRVYVISCLMGAVSDDGLHWTKSPRPILLWDQELTHGWALVDGKIGAPPPAYQGSYHRPSLMWDEGRWRLWFDYFLPGTFVSMGYAENTGEFLDPDQWRVVRAGEEPLLRDWPNTSVVRVSDTYYAFSDAPGYGPDLGGDGRQLTVAESSDGLAWTVTGRLHPEDDGASSHVAEASVVTTGGGVWLYLFYSWKPPVEPWDYRYKAIRSMRRRLR
jgi:hypothetical protein